MKLEESDPTVQGTLLLLKSTLYMTEILGPLPKEAYLTMKLIFNETTPADYQPPGFGPSENEKFFFPSNAVKFELGKVSTEFNRYRMFLKTALSKEPLSQIYEESVMTGSQRSQNNETNEENDHENFNMPSHSKVSLKSKDVFPSKHEQGKEECICDCREDSGMKILRCTACGIKQHSICYGILNSDEIESEFYCIQCINEAPRTVLEKDTIYTTLDSDEQKELCAFRRALVFCTSLKQVTPFQLEKGLKCDKQLAKAVIAKLEKEGYIKRVGQKYIVNNMKIVKTGYWMYFRKTENKENLEKGKPSPVNASDDEEFVKEKPFLNKRKSNFATGEEILSEDDYMDYAIEDKVKKLDLKGSQEEFVSKLSRRRSLKTTVDEEASQRKPKKRKCSKKHEIINLKE